MLAKNGHVVVMLVLDVTAQLFYKVHESVKVIQAPLHFGITSRGNVLTRKVQFIVHLAKLKKIYKQLNPALIISTEYSLTIPTWLTMKGQNKMVLAWGSTIIFFGSKKNRFWNVLFRYTYPKLHTVVCQNTTEKVLFEKMGCKAIVIPYVIPQQKERAFLQNKIILSIGWLIKRKGVDMIPAVAEIIFKKHPDWRWKIIGEGEEYDFLISQLVKKNLQNNVVIQKPGSPNIEKEYLNASIFVLLSRFECLPLVLLEAATFGLPGVAFNCPTGPADIIHDNEDGYLIPMDEVAEMASKIIELIEDDEKRKQFGLEAYRNSNRYAEETIYKKWLQLFKDL